MMFKIKSRKVVNLATKISLTAITLLLSSGCATNLAFQDVSVHSDAWESSYNDNDHSELKQAKGKSARNEHNTSALMKKQYSSGVITGTGDSSDVSRAQENH